MAPRNWSLPFQHLRPKPLLGYVNPVLSSLSLTALWIKLPTCETDNSSFLFCFLCVAVLRSTALSRAQNQHIRAGYPSTKDELEGRVHEVNGKVKEKTGQLTNDPDLEANGQDEKIGGKVQKKIGQVEKVLGK